MEQSNCFLRREMNLRDSSLPFSRNGKKVLLSTYGLLIRTSCVLLNIDKYVIVTVGMDSFNIRRAGVDINTSPIPYIGMTMMFMSYFKPCKGQKATLQRRPEK